MKDSALYELASVSEIRELEAGDVVSSPGHFDHRVHIIERGNVDVLKVESSGIKHVLASFIAGESFGELDLLDPGSSPYEVRAEGSATVCSVPGSHHEAAELFASRPALGAEIAEGLLGEISDRIRSANKLVSEKAPWIEGLKRQIHTDKLTGLSNATYLREELPGILARGGAKATILIVKPDNFKAINDTYGHDAGDAVLGLLAETVRSFAGKDICARFKGDVFCIVLQNASKRAVGTRAKSLLSVVRSLDMKSYTGGDDFTMTASIGLCNATATSESIEAACGDALSIVMKIREEGGDRLAWKT